MFYLLRLMHPEQHSKETPHIHSVCNPNINENLSYVELWQMSCVLHSEAVGR